MLQVSTVLIVRVTKLGSTTLLKPAQFFGISVTLEPVVAATGVTGLELVVEAGLCTAPVVSESLLVVGVATTLAPVETGVLEAVVGV